MPELFRPSNHDVPQLKELYLSCFNESEDAAEYMFENMLTANNAYAVKVEQEIAAALYLLPCGVFCGSRTAKASYLMGAGTKFKYRNKGIMSRLIKYALDCASKNGDEFSVLEPAGESLYSYYTRFGYKKAYTSSVFDYSLSEKDKKAYDSIHLTKSSFDIWSHLRFNICKSIRGSVHWPDAHLIYCSEINKIYGGGILGFDYGYALYTRDGNGFFVDELMCLPEYLNAFLRTLAISLGTERLTVRCPVGLNKNAGRISMGMLLPLKNSSAEPVLNENSYLGLSLD